MHKMNIACDFDGTIVVHRFPAIGKEVPGAISTLKTLQDSGHKIFLWTMRGYHSDYKRCLEDAVGWCESLGLFFDAINRTTSGFGTSSPKQHANIYIDDAALGCPLCVYDDSLVVDWGVVASELFRMKLITSEQYDKIYEDIIRSYTEQDQSYIPYREITYAGRLQENHG